MKNAEAIAAYSWSNKKYANDVIKESEIEGRKVYKRGNLQNVTFAGQLYKFDEPDTEGNKYFLSIGFSKQHPADNVADTELGEEIAMTNAWTKPVITLKLRTAPTERYFHRVVTGYYVSNIHNKLGFVMTPEEKESKMMWEF